MMKLHHWIILILAVILIGSFAMWPRSTVEKVNDELTGSWRAGGVNDDGFEWIMRYTFDNGSYTLTTDTGYGENGTYKITKRFEDGSLLVLKTYDNGKKTYEMGVTTDPNHNTIYIEGAKLDRVQ